MKTQITKEELYSLTQVKDSIFYLKLFVLIFLLFISFILIFYSTEAHWMFLGMIISGLMYAHATELQHQCLHYTAFKKKKINRFFGVLLGLPMLVNFTSYRKQHLQHHQKIGSEEDVEFFSYPKTDNRLSFFLHAFSLKRYFRLFLHFFKCKDSLKNNIIILTFPLLLFCSCTFFHSLIFVKFWLIPVILISEPIHYFIEIPEHYFCNKNDRAPFENTRTIAGNKISFWFTNGNNFHVEHHLFSSIPIHNLPKLNKLIKNQTKYLNRSYFEFYKSIFLLREKI